MEPIKHEWQKNDYDDEIDIFAFEAGEYHNGPRCVRCGVGFCHHCDPDRYNESCLEQTSYLF